MRSSSVVRSVRYGKGRIALLDVRCPGPLRGRAPAGICAHVGLGRQQTLATSARRVAKTATRSSRLPWGDCMVTIRHDGSRDIMVEGDDPQETLPHDRLPYEGSWTTEDCAGAADGNLHVALQTGAGAARLSPAIKSASSAGPTQAAAGPTCISTASSSFAASISGAPRPAIGRSSGTRTDWPRATTAWKSWPPGRKIRSQPARGSIFRRHPVVGRQGENGFGQGSGPTETQRVIFGYIGRKDYVDSAGHVWRPATEFIMRLGSLADLVPASFWTEPQLKEVAGTPDPELYRYGVHGRDFTAYFTVSPSAELSRAAEVLPGAKAGQARRQRDQHPDRRQISGHRHGHRRHGRRAGQSGRPGLQRHPAETWRDCHSFLGHRFGPSP